MKSFALKSSVRGALGKKDSKNARRAGLVPCVLYGGKEPVHFSAPEMDFKKLIYTPDVFTVDLSVDGNEYKAVMRDIQFHPVSERLVHIDFQEIAMDKPVVMDIPVKITGTAIGVREGGVLLTKLRKLKVKALPANLPDRIELNVEPLAIGKGIRVGDIVLDKVEILNGANNIITIVKTARAVVEETPVAGATTEVVAPVEGATPVPAADEKEALKKDEKAPAKK